MENGIKDLLIDELHDLLSSEKQIVEALPKMVTAAESPDLKKAFEGHLKETKKQVQRLEKIFKLLKVVKKEKLCKATKGLIDECKDVLKEFKNKSALRDAALISKAQRIEHYEIAAYGTVRTFAKEINLDAIANLLQETLDEEGNADKKLTKIAEGGLLKTGINYLANTNETPAKISKNKVSAPKKVINSLKKTLTNLTKKATNATSKKTQGTHKKTASSSKKTLSHHKKTVSSPQKTKTKSIAAKR